MTIAVNSMNKLNSTVDVSIGEEFLSLHLVMLSFKFILLDISKEQFQVICNGNDGKFIGLGFYLKFQCNDNRLEMHDKVYRAKCSNCLRLSADKYLLKFEFIDLDANQYREIRKTVPRMGLTLPT